jgi:hypothetical protein
MQIKQSFSWPAVLLVLTATVVQAQVPAVSVTGELKRWHKVVVTLDGPATSATATPNPFLDLRMDVTFTHAASGTTLRVPGYFDADGNAANTSAMSGNKWRAILAPSKVGQWSYRISFRQGPGVAGANSFTAGTAVAPYDGRTGSFSVTETDKTGRDFRAKGMLNYVNKHHLQFEGTGEYFLKVGSDSPENLLAYDDFDDTPNYTWEGRGSATGGGFRHNYAPHVSDWKPGDPTWKTGKGKGLIGAMNYLASKGLNSQSFEPYTIHGDDRNVSPYIDSEDRTRISIPKVNQWEIVFEHMDKLGLYLEVKMMEVENDWDHDGGELGPERKLYYRELIARFGHHLALNWNIGEENNNTRAQRMAFADYIAANDPYHHLIVIHPTNLERLYMPLLEKGSNYRGASLQINFYDVFDFTRFLRMASDLAGVPWVITSDENRPGPAGVALKQANAAVSRDVSDPEHNEGRKGALWANIMAGGAGMNTYVGFGTDVGDPSAVPARVEIPDLMLEDFRAYDKWWDQMRVAHTFFIDHKVPFQEMSNRNELLSTGWALANADTIVGYLPTGAAGGRRGGGGALWASAYGPQPPAAARPGGPGGGRVVDPNAPRQAPGAQGGVEAVGPNAGGDRHGKGPTAGPGAPPATPTVDLHAYKGAYEVRWYDPRTGGALQSGSITTLTAGGKDSVEFGQPPSDPERDWVVLIRPVRR